MESEKGGVIQRFFRKRGRSQWNRPGCGEGIAMSAPCIGFDLRWRAVLDRPLALPNNFCYNTLRKTKMRQLTGAATPVSLRRCEHHLHNGHKAAPLHTLYDISPVPARGGERLASICRFFVLCGMCMRIRFLTLCRHHVLHSVFVFRPGGGGRKPPFSPHALPGRTTK